MVYCNKCGRENEDGAKFCTDCGFNLTNIKRETRTQSDECFGLPQGGTIFGLFIGAIIVLWGMTQVFDWNIELGTYATIAFGLLILTGAVYGLTKRR